MTATTSWGPGPSSATKSLGVDLATGIREAMADPSQLIVERAATSRTPSRRLRAAVAAAQNADIVLLAVGESQNMSGEAQSRTEIGLPACSSVWPSWSPRRASRRSCCCATAAPGAGRARSRPPGRAGHLVPGQRDGPRRGRRAVRQGQSVGPPAGQLPARERPGAVRLQPPHHRPSRAPGRRQPGVQGPLAHHPQRGAVPVRPRAVLHQLRAQRRQAVDHRAWPGTTSCSSRPRSPTPAGSPASTWSSSTSATGWPAARGRCASSSASCAWR
jgi:hypothetical protein